MMHFLALLKNQSALKQSHHDDRSAYASRMVRDYAVCASTIAAHLA
jgi:hypothetical protein